MARRTPPKQCIIDAAGRGYKARKRIGRTTFLCCPARFPGVVINVEPRWDAVLLQGIQRYAGLLDRLTPMGDYGRN